jgi:phage-related minor tail protein
MAGASKDIGKLVVKMQMDLDGLRADVQTSNAIMKKASQGWQAEMKAAGSSVANTFKGSFLSDALRDGIAIVSQGVAQMFNDFDRLADSADKLNTTTTTLQEIGFAASQTGADLGDAEKVIAKLQVNLGKIGTGEGKSANEALKQLGLTANQLRSMDSGDALAKIGEQLKTLPDQTSRMAAATALLGKSAGDLLPLVMQFTELREQARALGVVIDEQTVRSAAEFVDQTEILNLQGRALLADVLKPLLPVLMDTAKAMGGTAESAKDMGSGLAGAKTEAARFGEELAALIRLANQVDDALDSAMRATRQHGQDTRTTLQQMGGRLTFGTSGAEVKARQEAQQQAREAAAEQKRQAEFASRWQAQTLVRLNNERQIREQNARLAEEGAVANQKAAEDAAAEAKAKREAATATKAQKDAEEELLRQRKEMQDLLRQAIDNENKLREARDHSIRDLADAQALLMGASQDQIDLQNAANDGYSKETQINQQRAESTRKLAAELDQWAQFAKQAFDEQTGGMAEAKRALDNLTAAYNTGRISLDEYSAGMRAVDEQTRKLTQEQEQWAQTLGAGFGEIFGAIVTGAEDAEEAVKRLLIQLAAMAAQQAATKWISSLFTPAANGRAFGPQGVTAFAQGGVVMAPTGFAFAGGRMGLMGEAGPEAVLPLQRGANGKLGVAAAGGGLNLTVINNTPAQVSASADDPSNMRITIDQMSSAIAAKIARGGNEITSSLERAYGVKR